MPLRAPKGFIDESDPKVCQIGHPAPPWLVNYADLMTELVCFFVILYALSASLNKGITNSKDKIDEMMKNGKIKGEVEVNKQGLKITLEEKGGASFFQSGSAETTGEIDQYISQVAPVLKPLIQDHDLIVQGHSDNQRISNEFFDSNWELSAARATSVARLLVDKYGFPPAHIAAAGYGEYRPIASNETPEGRSKNRRVVLFISAEKSEVHLKGSPASSSEPAVPGAAPEPAPQNSDSAPAVVPAQPEAPSGGNADVKAGPTP
jgi:chemotaxis protein MotB